MGGNLTFNDNDDVQLKGATDLTLIGNVSDSLKTNVTASALPTGAATSALQTTGNTSLSSIDTKTPALGQALAAASVPVVLTAAQITTLTPLTTVAVTQSGTWNINNISGTISLPTGASTSALQTTGNSSLSSIDTKTPALGQALAAASVPVVLTAAQLITLTPPTTVTANQGTANTAANGWPTKTTDGTDIALVTANGEQKVVDGLRNGGVFGALSVPTANTAVEAKVGASRLTNRKFLYIYSNNNGLFWGLDNTVTTSNGIPLVNGQVVSFSIDPDSTFQVWLVGSSNSKSAQIVESA